VRHARGVDAVPEQPQLAHPPGQVHGELPALPVVGDHRQHLVTDEGTGTPEQRVLLLAEVAVDADEVGAQGAPQLLGEIVPHQVHHDGGVPDRGAAQPAEGSGA